MYQLYLNLRTLTSWNHQSQSRPVIRLLKLYLYRYKNNFDFHLEWQSLGLHCGYTATLFIFQCV